MSRIRSRDTKPELLVRRYLYSRGYRYRKNVKGLPGTPDIVMRRYGVVIFIHGCFWHGHEPHFRMPATNREFWERKIARNRQRDDTDRERLRRMGWDVIVIWECQLQKASRRRTLTELEYHINRLYLARVARRNARPYDEPAEEISAAAESPEAYGKPGR